jgi:DNA polymerase III epsilon subunit family exonuclease
MPVPNLRTDLLGRSTFVAFDTETTGLWALSNRLVEIAAVKFRADSDTREEFQTLIDPGRPIPAEANAVHGISDEMVRGSPGSAEAIAAFLNFCGPDSIWVAHNAPFDMSFVGNELNRAGLAYPPNLILDTVDIFRRFAPGLASYSLLSLARKYDLAQSQEHRGLSDADLVRRLFLIALQILPTIDSAEGIREQLSVCQLADWKPEQAELPARFSDLTAAVERGSSVEIIYRGAGGIESSRVIRPLQVHRLGGIHYIVAYCEKSQAERTFRLDRIKTYFVV